MLLRHCTTIHYTSLNYTLQYNTIPHYTTLHDSLLKYTALYYLTLHHCPALHTAGDDGDGRNNMTLNASISNDRMALLSASEAANRRVVGQLNSQVCEGMNGTFTLRRVARVRGSTV